MSPEQACPSQSFAEAVETRVAGYYLARVRVASWQCGACEQVRAFSLRLPCICKCLYSAGNATIQNRSADLTIGFLLHWQGGNDQMDTILNTSRSRSLSGAAKGHTK